ncbi:nuclease-related domain-containing protein [Streptomyces sp. NPDC053560]|uniref:nuclease-related domain-containing protein n=1 Tax=Streptomyces sp. NPDC053560 TaxID=3365711 RepID=UPI0037CF0A1A
MTPTLVLAAAAVVRWLRRRRRPGLAGTSAAARARQLRTPLVMLAELVGVRTVAGRQAARYDAGAAGERRIGALLDQLRNEGWTILHDLGLPTGNANVDHLAISPRGVVVLVDTKRWDARYRVRVDGNRLLHGTRDVTDRVSGTRHEALTVARVLGGPVIPVAVIDGAPVDEGETRLGPIRIVPASSALAVLRQCARSHSGHGPGTGARAARLLKPHGRN